MSKKGGYVKEYAQKIIRMTTVRSDAMVFATEEVALQFMEKNKFSNNFYATKG